VVEHVLVGDGVETSVVTPGAMALAASYSASEAIRLDSRINSIVSGVCTCDPV
jgi:hypothetical protein